jgi:hypothetical protein
VGIYGEFQIESTCTPFTKDVQFDVLDPMEFGMVARFDLLFPVKCSDAFHIFFCQFLIQTSIGVFFGSLEFYGRGIKHYGLGSSFYDDGKISIFHPPYG